MSDIPPSKITGSTKLRLPDDLREPLKKHLEYLRELYLENNWGGRVGFGEHPALVVVDLALFWTEPQHQMGSNVDSVVEATARLLEAARSAEIPIFFTSLDYNPANPPSPRDNKCQLDLKPGDEPLLQLDPRLNHKPSERIILKKYASAFKDTDFHEILSASQVDTLIVTGVSTSHCIYATCRDATDNYRIIVPAEAVGERCEIMHEVNLLDIDIDLGDVMPVDKVIEYLKGISHAQLSSD